MPQFTIIIPTVGRTTELEKMLASLSDQSPAALQVIVVDQNDDCRVDPILCSLPPNIEVSHLRLATKGASVARNVGLSVAEGEIVAFPDDDCWYPAALLAHVEKWFGDNAEYDMLAVGAKDEQGIPSGNRWVQDQCDIRPINAFRTTFCNSLFFRRRALPDFIHFDESLSAGEETDFVLRLLKAGIRARFDRTWHVGHPRRDMLSGTVSHNRAKKYGQGMGHLARRHSLSLLWLGLLSYDLIRASAVFLKGDFSNGRFCLSHAHGLFRGFVYDALGHD
jgi:glycosyltransferase involved in cell wall biosynthesis